MKLQNRKAYYEYHILEEYTAGIMLVGSEVKSIRDSNINFKDSYIYIHNNEVFMKQMFIGKYKQAIHTNHEEVRDRKLLLTKKQIRDIQKQLQVTGITSVPLEIFELNGKFKVKIAIAKGKKLYDKRESIKEKDIKIQTQRELI
jgi:SsrA-binding protein